MQMLGITNSQEAKNYQPTPLQQGMLAAWEQLNPTTSLEEAFHDAISYFEKLERGTAYEFELHSGGKAVMAKRDGSGRNVFIPLDLFNFMVKNAGKVSLKGGKV